MRTVQELFSLAGKNAVVTGGSRGLGLQMAEALGEQGARVLISSRKQGELDEAKLLESYPGWRLKVVRDPLEAIVTGNADEPVDLLVPQPVGPFLANVCLLLVLGLLFLEIVLAWWFGHYTTAEGAVAPGEESAIFNAVQSGSANVSSLKATAARTSVVRDAIVVTAATTQMNRRVSISTSPG